MISEFMKRRIIQLIGEYRDPLVVLQQMMSTAELANEPQKAAELAEFILMSSMDVPGVDFSGIEKLGEQLGFNVARPSGKKQAAKSRKSKAAEIEYLDDDDEDFDEDFPEGFKGDFELDWAEAENVAEYMDDMQEIYEKAIEKSLKDFEKLKNKPVKLTHLFKAVSQTVIVKDMLSLLKLIDSPGEARLEVNRFGLIEPEVFELLTRAIAESPAKNFSIEALGNKIQYIDILLTIVEQTGLVSITKKGIALTKSGKTVLEGNGIEDAYFRMLLELTVNAPTVSLSHEDIEDVEISPGSMAHNFIYALSKISQDWTSIEEAYLPLIACVDDFTRFDLLIGYSDDEEYAESIEQMRFLVDGFHASFGALLEYFGVIEIKDRRNFPDKVRLTALGYEVLSGILKHMNRYPVICSKIDYISSSVDSFLFFTEQFPNMKEFRKTADFRKCVSLNEQVSAFYDELIEMTTDGIPGKAKLEKFESEINNLHTEMGEVFEHIKKTIKYETNIEKFQNRKKLK